MARKSHYLGMHTFMELETKNGAFHLPIQVVKLSNLVCTFQLYFSEIAHKKKLRYSDAFIPYI